jgi:hypothetical protein
MSEEVPNGDDGEDLGLYEADYLPRVGDKFFLFDPRLTGGGDQPFEAVSMDWTSRGTHTRGIDR